MLSDEEKRREADLFGHVVLTREPIDLTFQRVGGPIHLPSLDDEERAELLAELRPWVEQLRARFALDARSLPPCWERHPAIVEAVTALRDFERGAYAVTSPAGSGIDFLRALTITREFVTEQTALAGCSGQGHREVQTLRSATSRQSAWGVPDPPSIGAPA